MGSRFLSGCFVGCLAFSGAAPASAQSQSTTVRMSDLPAEGAAADTPWHLRAVSALGLVVLVGLAWLMSPHRRIVPWRVILWGTGLQLLFGLLVLKTAAGMWLFSLLNDAVVGLLDFTEQGSRFVFGSLMEGGFSFAVQILPTIIFFSAFMSVLYHIGIMERVVRGIAWVMQRTMRTSGAETLSTAANIFVGQTEAPLVVRPFVATMTLSELNAVMVGGFATVAGGVLGAYTVMLRDVFPDIAGHLISASVLGAPAALVIAKAMLPETETPKTLGAVDIPREKPAANVLDAAARGAADGAKLALNVAAMLLAFIALIALLNYLIGAPAHIHNAFAGRPEWDPLTIEQILAYVFWPLAWIMGVEAGDCTTIGRLLGEKIMLTELIAYTHLGDTLRAGSTLSPRSIVIATYALCGFANFGSIAIQIGGIGGMAPERRSDIARLGFRAMIGGLLASCMTAAVAGILI